MGVGLAIFRPAADTIPAAHGSAGAALAWSLFAIVAVSVCGWVAGRLWGRKRLLLIAFGVLPVRAVLYTLTADPVALVAIEILDGVSGCIFGIVSGLEIADLTRGSGRFNFTLGVIGTAVGIGAALS